MFLLLQKDIRRRLQVIGVGERHTVLTATERIQATSSYEHPLMIENVRQPRSACFSWTNLTVLVYWQRPGYSRPVNRCNDFILSSPTYPQQKTFSRFGSTAEERRSSKISHMMHIQPRERVCVARVSGRFYPSNS